MTRILFLGLFTIGIPQRPLQRKSLHASKTPKCTVFGGADAFVDITEETPESGSYVHIRIQMRNGRKSLTTVQGLASDLDLKKILKFLKKKHSTNGTIVQDKSAGKVLQMQGDQRKNVYDFLIMCNICPKEEVKMHGF